MGFDWASENYLADALDSAERRAERAEEYLAEQESGRSNLVHSFTTSLTGMGVAGGLAYASQTLFRDTKTNKPGMLGIGSGPASLGINLLGGLALKAAALFHNKLGIPDNAVPYMEAGGQGALDHWAVMFGMNAGAGAAGVSGSKDWDKTKHAYTSGTQAPSLGGGNPAAPTPSMGGGQYNPESMMTADQVRVWRSYAG